MDRLGSSAASGGRPGRRGVMAAPPRTSIWNCGGTVRRSSRSTAITSAATPSIRSVETFLETFRLPAASCSTATLLRFQRSTGWPSWRSVRDRIGFLERLRRRRQRREPLAHRDAGEAVLVLQPRHQVGRVPRVEGNLAHVEFSGPVLQLRRTAL